LKEKKAIDKGKRHLSRDSGSDIVDEHDNDDMGDDYPLSDHDLQDSPGSHSAMDPTNLLSLGPWLHCPPFATHLGESPGWDLASCSRGDTTCKSPRGIYSSINAYRQADAVNALNSSMENHTLQIPTDAHSRKQPHSDVFPSMDFTFTKIKSHRVAS
jgi:hypothetical protein